MIPRPIFANNWFTTPRVAELRQEIQNLYAVVEELQKEIAELREVVDDLS